MPILRYYFYYEEYKKIEESTNISTCFSKLLKAIINENSEEIEAQKAFIEIIVFYLIFALIILYFLQLFYVKNTLNEEFDDTNVKINISELFTNFISSLLKISNLREIQHLMVATNLDNDPATVYIFTLKIEHFHREMKSYFIFKEIK